jgi:RimJ/RimL family protein N-acetyltransferase
MGLELVARSRGLGSKLLKMAIEWAREQESLHWIDITVFAHNTPARKLYAAHGFVEQYTSIDRLRVEGVSIDDVVMTLKLR